jgi:hypothetical protein
VEVRGVEPRSEEKILKTSTRISYLWISRKGTPVSRINLSPAQAVHVSMASSFFLEHKKELAQCSRRPSQILWAGLKRTGYLMLLGCQCVIVIGTYDLPLFIVDTVTTARSSKLPHPRRSHFTPNRNFDIYNIENTGGKTKLLS